MDAADRHVLDAVPVGLQVWEAVGDALTLRYANRAAAVLPEQPAWLEACVAHEELTLDIAVADSWWRARATPLGGRSISVAAWDITEHKVAERSLRASERLNREIISGLLEGVLVVDTGTRVVLANEAAARLFGVAVGDLVGRPLSGVPGDLLDDRGRLLEADRLPLPRALRGGAGRGGERPCACRSRGRCAARRCAPWSCGSCAATARCCGSRRRRARCSTRRAGSTARSLPMTTSRCASSRTGARATRPTPTR